MKRVVMTGILAIGMLLAGSAVYGENYSTVKVSADSLNVREFNNQDSKLLGQARHDQQLIVLNEVGDWYAIRTSDGKMGFVKKEFCVPVGAYAEGHVSKTDVNLRDKPSAEGTAVLGKLQPDQVLQVLSKDDNWYKVTAGDKTGYVRADMLALGAAPAQDAVVSRGGNRDELVAFAKKQLGKPYSWGKSGPNSFDCSGFVGYVYRNVYNKDLGHSSVGMSSMGTAVDKANLAVGDLVFFATGGSKRINHVGMYIGGGNFIHASSSKTNAVMISTLSSGGYSNCYRGARRIDVN